MNYSLSKKAVSVKETVFTGSSEQPIDLDLTLPDYCPDMMKILKCRVSPKILTKSISADRLEIEGSAELKILYVDAVRKSLRCSDHNIPFSASFNMKQNPQNGIVFAKVRTEYINCRALSPRRLDIHGAFSVSAEVICKSETEFPCDIDNNTVQIKKSHAKLSVLEGMAQQQFTLTESVSLGTNNGSIETVLKSDATVIKGECKAISNKVIVKGDVNIRVLYLADINTGQTGIFDYTLPFSEILDADGVDENCLCLTDIELVNHTVNVKNDYAESGTMADFEVKLSVTAMGYRSDEITYIDDAYSTEYELNLLYHQMTLSEMQKSYVESCMTKSTVEIGANSIQSVTDIWCEQCQTSVISEDGNFMVKGKLHMCVLALDNDNMPFYSERVIDFTYPLSKIAENNQVEVVATVQSVSYRINGANSLDFRIETKLSVTVTNTKTVRYVASLTPDTDKPRIKDNPTALTLYYTTEGESVWEIARHYGVDCQQVMEENELTEDTIPCTMMLFIPNV